MQDFLNAVFLLIVVLGTYECTIMYIPQKNGVQNNPFRNKIFEVFLSTILHGCWGAEPEFQVCGD